MQAIPHPEDLEIDYVLVHSNKKWEELDLLNQKDKRTLEEIKQLKENEIKRNRFEDALKNERFTIGEEANRDKVFKKLHCQFERLCEEAERVKLEMPLEGVSE